VTMMSTACTPYPSPSGIRPDKSAAKPKAPRHRQKGRLSCPCFVLTLPSDHAVGNHIMGGTTSSFILERFGDLEPSVKSADKEERSVRAKLRENLSKAKSAALPSRVACSRA